MPTELRADNKVKSYKHLKEIKLLSWKPIYNKSQNMVPRDMHGKARYKGEPYMTKTFYTYSNTNLLTNSVQVAQGSDLFHNKSKAAKLSSKTP